MGNISTQPGVGTLLSIGFTNHPEHTGEVEVLECSLCKHRWRARFHPYKALEAGCPCPDCNHHAYMEYVEEDELHQAKQDKEMEK